MTAMTARIEICHLPTQTTGLKAFFIKLVMAHSTWRQRQILKSLEAEALDDIGLTKDEADKEARKPIWDVPAHWRR